MQGGSSIRVISECFIKPKNVCDESKKPFYLGSFELGLMSYCYLQRGLLFDRFQSKEDGGNMSFFFERLAQSLSSTLDHFYPLPGQLVTEEDLDKHESIIFVDYNKGPGAKFIHATLDNVTINDIISPTYVPTKMIQSFFELGQIPTNHDGHNEPLLAIQVTELADGIFLGISANHVVIDGLTFQNFLSSWSELFQSNDTKISRPPIYDRWFPKGYGPIIKIPNTQLNELRSRLGVKNKTHIEEMIFHFSYESMTKLKAKANADYAVSNKISSFQALSSLIWRSIARARRDCSRDDEDSVCYIVANARSRLNPPLSQNYFGNFVKAAMKQIKVCSLVENSLGWVALLLQQAIEELTDQDLRGKFIKWIKYPIFTDAGSPCSNSVLISGTPRDDVYNVEFGLGKPVTIRTGSDKYDGKVVLRPGKEGKGSVSVEICLSLVAMVALQQDQELVSFLS